MDHPSTPLFLYGFTTQLLHLFFLLAVACKDDDILSFPFSLYTVDFHNVHRASDVRP